MFLNEIVILQAKWNENGRTLFIGKTRTVRQNVKEKIG